MHCQFVFRCSKAGVIAGSSQLLFPLEQQRKKFRSGFALSEEHLGWQSAVPKEAFLPPSCATCGLQIAKRAIQYFQKKICILFIHAHRRREPDRLSPKTPLTEEQSHFLACLQNLRALFFG